MTNRTWDDGLPLVINEIFNGNEWVYWGDLTSRGRKVMRLLVDLGYAELDRSDLRFVKARRVKKAHVR